MATVLDEVMVRLLYLREIHAVTASMETMLLKPIRWSRGYRFEGWIVEDLRRAVITEAEAFDAETGECAA